MPNLRTHIVFGLLLGGSSLLRAETEVEKAARLIKDKHYSEAQVLLDRAVQADPRNAEVWFRMGEVQLASKNPGKAVEFADKAIQLDPNRASYHRLRGMAQVTLAQSANIFKGLSLAKDGRTSMEKAVQLEPGNREALLTLFGYYVNAPGIAGGGLDKAKSLADQALPLDPSRGHYMKGFVLQQQKNPGAAQAEYRLALAADPTYAYAYNMLGYVELEMKQVDMALEHFRKQVELDPGNANCYDSLGDGLVAKGLMDEAIASYRKALSVDPNFFASMRSLGKALEQAGRRDEAIQHYRQCAQVGTQKGIPQLVSASKDRLKALGVKE